MPDVLLRSVLTAEAFVAVLLMARFLGALWNHRKWPTRVIIIGVWLILFYVALGQVKAFYLHIVFDGFSLFGLFAYAVLLVGLIAYEVHESRTRRGR